MNRHLLWRGVVVIAAISGAAAIILARSPRLGLDLRGGTQIVLQAEDGPRQPADDDAVSRTLEVLRRRVDQLGVSEPSLQRSGSRRIIVELPGVSDPQQATEIIGKTAQMEFRRVLAFPAPGAPVETAPPDAAPPGVGVVVEDQEGRRTTVGPPALTGDAVEDASAVIDPSTGAWHVQVEFRRSGAESWARFTGEAACSQPGDPQRSIAIVLDQTVISTAQVAPEIACNEGITGGTTMITGSYDEDEAKELALLIRAGALPVPVNVVEQRTVGPTLGEAAIKASIQAAIIGASLTIGYMILYYRLLGAVAAVALLAYGLLSFGLLLALDATLTLPGIAGFVLAIGMAVDANVLVFERIKEEYAAKGKVVTAVSEGFKKAWSAIADSNATTLLAAILLFFLGSGAVRGFGVTLSIGVAVSMFTALVVTRILIEMIVRLSPIHNRPRLLGVGSRRRLTEWLERNPINLIGHRRIWFTVSFVAVIGALAGPFVRGLNYGIEFTGGRLLEYSTTASPDINELRAELAERGLGRIVVQESDEGNIAIRTGALDSEGERTVQSAVEALGGQTEELRDELVGPSIGDELRRKALIALALALMAQLGYLAMRFRWNYGLAAVTAMFHDVLILVGLFSWLGKEIDGVFLAALLTVIGYSINDSVVVFDRIREQHRVRIREPLEAVANDACLQTIPRTVNTGLGALFILLTLYFLGGESLTDFALALGIGILVGTYSSVFTAAPTSVLLDKLKPAPAVIPRTQLRGQRSSFSSSSRQRAQSQRAGRR